MYIKAKEVEIKKKIKEVNKVEDIIIDIKGKQIRNVDFLLIVHLYIFLCTF